MLPSFCQKLRLVSFARALTAFALLLALVSIATPALAQRTIRVPADQPTIQAGINAAANGDTVLVAPGTYNENIDFVGKAITVTSSDGPATTIIDGGTTAKGAVVRFVSGEPRTSTIAGFTIQKGTRDPTGQIRAVTGGVYVGNSSQASILNNRILNNFCEQIQLYDGSALIQGNTISDPAPPDLGACDVYQGTDVLIYGGGNPSYPQPSSVIRNNTIENSPAVQGFSGLAIGLWVAPQILIQNNIIRGNANALFMQNSTSLTFTDNLVYGNHRPRETTAGGSYSFIQVGGETYAGPFVGIFTGNTIVGNTSEQASLLLNGLQTTPQVYLGGDLGQWLFGNNVVVGTPANPALVCNVSSTDVNYIPLSIDHNDLWNTDGSNPFTGACPVQFGTYGNVSIDPQFLNAASSDYHLSPGSPLLDQGNTSMPDYLSIDLDGKPRMSSSTGRSYSVIDPGVYESQGATAPPATIVQAQPSTYFPFGCCNTGPFAIEAALSSTLGIPTGSVTFSDNGAILGSGTLDTSGKASFVPKTVSRGLHSYVVTYGGQGVFAPGISVRFYLRFESDFTNGTQTQLTLAASPSPAALASAVTLRAALTATSGTPAGSISFTDGSTTIGTVPLSNGAATLTTSTLSRGGHTLTASYPGDGTYAPASATVSETILGTATTTTVTTSAYNVPANTPITLTASTTATGTTPDLTKLQILDGATPLAPLAVGTGSVTATVTLAPGTHILTGKFAGDTTSEPSTSAPVTVIVQGAPTTTALTADPVQPVAFQGFYATLRISAAGVTPNGDLTLSIDGRAASAGSAKLLISKLLLNLAAGTHTLVATYTPADATTLPSSATLTLTVARAPVHLGISTVPAPFAQSQSATMIALLDDGTGRHLATGAVTPLIDGAAQPALPVNATGQISLQLQGLSIGTHTVTFTYPGDGNFLPAISPAAQITVLQRDFALKGDTTLSVPAGSYIVRNLSLTPLGGFADAVTLSCSNLPSNATCRFAQNPMPVTASGSVTVQFALDTSALPGYQQSARLQTGEGTGPSQGIRLAGTLGPLAACSGLLLLRSRRRRATPAMLLLALVTVWLTAGLAGCGGHGPAATPPGTYSIQINATSPGISHSQTITLHVIAPS